MSEAVPEGPEGTAGTTSVAVSGAASVASVTAGGTGRERVLQVSACAK